MKRIISFLLILIMIVFSSLLSSCALIYYFFPGLLDNTPTDTNAPYKITSEEWSSNFSSLNFKLNAHQYGNDLSSLSYLSYEYLSNESSVYRCIGTEDGFLESYFIKTNNSKWYYLASTDDFGIYNGYLQKSYILPTLGEILGISTDYSDYIYDEDEWAYKDVTDNGNTTTTTLVSFYNGVLEGVEIITKSTSLSSDAQTEISVRIENIGATEFEIPEFNKIDYYSTME